MSLYLLKQSDLMWNIKCVNAQIVPVGTNSSLFQLCISYWWFLVSSEDYWVRMFCSHYFISQVYDHWSYCGGVNKPCLALARKDWIFFCLFWVKGFASEFRCLDFALYDIYLNTLKGLEMPSWIRKNGEEEMCKENECKYYH